MSPTQRFALGLDFGSNSVRCLVLDLNSGDERAVAVWHYPSGDAGVLTDARDPHLARQNPADFIAGLEAVVRDALTQAARRRGFSPAAVVGLGVDATGSTPIPVDAQLRPLARQPAFRKNLNAQAWMWKDHTGMAEAEEITRLAAAHRPQYLAKCGGVYSSEWFFAKLWHCLRQDPKVFAAAATWLEFSDFIPALLVGAARPADVRRGVCAAGHKAFYSDTWGGFPDAEFLARLAPELAALRPSLGGAAAPIGTRAGTLCPAWAKRLGLPAGIPVSVGVLDAHSGAVGAGVGGPRLVKIVGTSACDLLTAPGDRTLPDIPGVCGIVPGSVLPGAHGIEAGQAAVGDIFNWFVTVLCQGNAKEFAALTRAAGALRPGESGLLALDWHNGNRCVLVDARLTGLILGFTVQTPRAAVFRALLESTAFGARRILDRLAEYKVAIGEIVASGGIAEKNAPFMQIYADVLRRPMRLAASSQTCALGAAMAGAVAAGAAGGGFANFADAQAACCRFQSREYRPDVARADIYDQLFALYRELHDSFGVQGAAANHYHVMKDLLALRQRVMQEA